MMDSHKWPLTASLAELPESDWSDATIEGALLNSSSDDDAPFQYAAIAPNQIRLLGLYPGRTHDPLMGRITVINFPNLTLSEWEALSYTWGNSADLPQSIIINGRKKQITANLASALQHLRRPREPMLLWIDSICINQDNNEEKGHQIRLMRFIYEKATCVIVWLGEYEQSAVHAMKFLNFIEEERPNDD